MMRPHRPPPTSDHQPHHHHAPPGVRVCVRDDGRTGTLACLPVVPHAHSPSALWRGGEDGAVCEARQRGRGRPLSSLSRHLPPARPPTHSPSLLHAARPLAVCPPALPRQPLRPRDCHPCHRHPRRLHPCHPRDCHPRHHPRRLPVVRFTTTHVSCVTSTCVAVAWVVYIAPHCVTSLRHHPRRPRHPTSPAWLPLSTASLPSATRFLPHPPASPSHLPTSFSPMDTSCAHTDTSPPPINASGPMSLARPPLAPCLPHPPILPRVRPPQRRIQPPPDYCFQPFHTRECGLWLYVC